jgi:hypothetical protein
MPGLSTRHRWGDGQQFWTKDEIPYHYKTERTCIRCDMARVTCHELKGAFEDHRTEFWRDGDQIDNSDGCVPPCDGRLELAEAARAEAVPA